MPGPIKKATGSVQKTKSKLTAKMDKKRTKVLRDKDQGRIGDDFATRRVLPTDDVGSDGKKFDVLARVPPPWAGIEVARTLTPAENLTKLHPSGRTYIPVFGLIGDCYKCIRVADGVHSKLVWDLCDVCRIEILRARGIPEAEHTRNSQKRICVLEDIEANRAAMLFRPVVRGRDMDPPDE